MLSMVQILLDSMASYVLYACSCPGRSGVGILTVGGQSVVLLMVFKLLQVQQF